MGILPRGPSPDSPAQPHKNPFMYLFSLPWYSHLYVKETVVHQGQFNRMKMLIGTRDGLGKLETVISLVQSQSWFSCQQIKKGASRTCNAGE